MCGVCVCVCVQVHVFVACEYEGTHIVRVCTTTSCVRSVCIHIVRVQQVHVFVACVYTLCVRFGVVLCVLCCVVCMDLYRFMYFFVFSEWSNSEFFVKLSEEHNIYTDNRPHYLSIYVSTVGPERAKTQIAEAHTPTHPSTRTCT